MMKCLQVRFGIFTTGLFTRDGAKRTTIHAKMWWHGIMDLDQTWVRAVVRPVIFLQTETQK